MLADALNIVVLKKNYRRCPCQQRSLQNGCASIHLETILSQIQKLSFFLPSQTRTCELTRIKSFSKKLKLTGIWIQTVPKPPGSTVNLPSAQETGHNLFLTLTSPSRPDHAGFRQGYPLSPKAIQHFPTIALYFNIVASRLVTFDSRLII